MTGSGTQADPYIIHDVNDLQAMENDLDAYYELANDIDASATSGWNAGAGFLPIGQSSPYFSGHFDGKGYSITDLMVNRGDTDDVGLFGITKNDASIQNVKLINADITGDWHTGGLVGSALGYPVISASSVSGSIVGADYVGGMIGFGGGNLVTSNSHSTASVSGGTNYVGGFVGYSKGNFNQCYATGAVISTGWWAGGFVGYDDRTTIDKSYATGNVNAGDINGDSFAGGFVGWADGTHTNCYARGSVTASGDYVGGYSGVSPNSMENCYSTGAVSGVGINVSGLNGDEGGDTINCFWDIETSGQATSWGGTGVTTSEMKTKSTFTDAGWDFISIWNIHPAVNDGYPCLRGITPYCCDVVATSPDLGKTIITLEALRNIEMMRQGRFYIDEQGRAVWESRFHRAA